jgi:hypothetical protein
MDGVRMIERLKPEATALVGQAGKHNTNVVRGKVVNAIRARCSLPGQQQFLVTRPVVSRSPHVIVLRCVSAPKVPPREPANSTARPDNVR